MTFLVAALLAAAGASTSAAATPAGDYTHAFAEPEGTTVWRITAEGNAWRVLRAADAGSFPAFELDAAARVAVWRRYDWPVGSSGAARCIGWHDAEASPVTDDVDGVLCLLPADARRAIAWLAEEPGDGFYADAMLGVIAVRHRP